MSDSAHWLSPTPPDSVHCLFGATAATQKEQKRILLVYKALLSNFIEPSSEYETIVETTRREQRRSIGNVRQVQDIEKEMRRRTMVRDDRRTMRLSTPN